MAIQTTYSDTLSQAVAGQIAHTEHAEVSSRTVAVAAIGFGKIAVQGASDHLVRAPDASNTKFVGITVRDQAQKTPDPDEYAVGETAGVLRSGSIWVTVGEAVAAGDPVYFVPATGAIMKTSTSNTLVPDARFETSAANGALALVRIG